jgi:hypothetical protein
LGDALGCRVWTRPNLLWCDERAQNPGRKWTSHGTLHTRGPAPVLVLRWLLDGTRIAQLAADNTISRSTGYSYLHEGITVIAGQAPGLTSALLAAKMAGYSHVNIDDTLIETDRCRTPGPTIGVDLW